MSKPKMLQEDRTAIMEASFKVKLRNNDTFDFNLKWLQHSAYLRALVEEKEPPIDCIALDRTVESFEFQVICNWLEVHGDNVEPAKTIDVYAEIAKMQDAMGNFSIDRLKQALFELEIVTLSKVIRYASFFEKPVLIMAMKSLKPNALTRMISQEEEDRWQMKMKIMEIHMEAECARLAGSSRRT
ncbi:hypothetical protein L596_030949 [Steinernema carpocapsae]|uniref:Uncharacterized protein n=1 Tax=Steinernema carpocapsae TaxID=34508 RepID=A0A4U5MHE5_STECR|nr:hypothetical protein L596_030949 [Steinernema carpocapsae]